MFFLNFQLEIIECFSVKRLTMPRLKDDIDLKTLFIQTNNSIKKIVFCFSTFQMVRVSNLNQKRKRYDHLTD